MKEIIVGVSKEGVRVEDTVYCTVIIIWFKENLRGSIEGFGRVCKPKWFEIK